MKKIFAVAVAFAAAVVTFFAQAAITVDSIAGHSTPDTAIVLTVGETAVLPQLGTGESYALLNRRFVNFDSESRTVTAMEPGISGVDYIVGDTTNTLCVFVLEKETDRSRVFVWNNTATSASWSEAANWIGLDGKTKDKIPNTADDIAYVDLTVDQDVTINLNSNISIGQVYLGRHQNVRKSATIGISGYCMTFDRSDELPARLQVCPNHEAKDWTLVFSGSGNAATSNITSKVNTFFDMGWDNGGETSADFDRCWTKFKFNNATIAIPDGVQLSLGGGSPRSYGSGAKWSEIDYGGSNYLIGSGTLAHTGRGIMVLSFNCSNFTGGLIEASGPHTGGYDRSRNFMLLTTTVGNAELTSAGYYVRSDADQLPSSKAVGYYGAGVNHGAHYGDSGEVANRLPWQGLTLCGGYGDFQPENPNPAWGVDKVQSNHTARLTVDRGCNFIHVLGRSATEMDGALQLNMFYAETLNTKTSGKGALYIRETNCEKGTSDTYRSMVSFPSFTTGQGVYGAADDCTTSEYYKMRPNVVARYDGWWDLCFAGVDANGQLRRPFRNDSDLNNCNFPTLNAYSKDKNIALTSDVTLGSLVLENRTKGKNLGNGKTLTIVSGGLILANELSAVGEVGAGADAGNLVFGDTAYVWPTAYKAASPNAISAKMTAPKGFVVAMAGHLQITGDQTGIDDEIVVNGGTLYLGYNYNNDSVVIDVPVRVYAGATLAVKSPDAIQNQIIYLDEVAGNAAKIAIDAGKEERCMKLYYRDSIMNGDDEWVSLKRGTYGATGSGAEFIDDARFTGTGVLRVRSDDLLVGFKLHIR